MGGIVYAQAYGSPWSWLLLDCAVLSMVTAVVVRKSRLLYVPIVLLAFIAGLVRQDILSLQQPTTNITYFHYTKQTVIGTVTGEPVRDDRTNVVFYVSNLELNGRPVAGDMRVKTLVGNAKEGYRVEVQGKIMPGLGRSRSAMSYAKVRVLSAQQPLLIQLKTEFSNGVRRALPEPAGSFILGILIGARTALPSGIQDTMALIGLSHLIAVSGYNLTIITLAIQSLTGRKWQWAGMVVTFWLIVGFVIATGASASIVRAGIMSALFLLAAYYGRKLEVLTCLALGAIITLLWSPAYINDLSWQLSFLALGGIVVLTPIVQACVPRRYGTLGEIAAVSIAAQLATMPLIALVFGNLSIIAPLANVLFLPLVPALMLLGFLAGILGVIVPALASAVAWPLARMVDFLIQGMQYLAHLPYASLRNVAPSWSAVVIFYISLLGLAAMGRKRGLGSSVADAIITGRKQGNPDERTQ